MTETAAHGTAEPALLEARGVVKSFRVRRSAGGGTRLRAVDGVDLTLGRGETLGLVGESGCGKSTLARLLLLLERPDEGTIHFDGVEPARLRGTELLAWRRRVQMVFQDPFTSLDGHMTAGQIVSEPFKTHRDAVPPEGVEARVAELLEIVGLRRSDAGRHPGEFSGGQRQRIGIARALALKPGIIVCDEPVSALDLSVQAQVLNLLTELQAELGVSYIFISHDLSVVRHVADRVAVMYLGRVVETGPTEQVFSRPRHPYTAALLAAAPTLDARSRRDRERLLLSGEVPSPVDPPSGCHFRTRCPKAQERCAREVPPLEPASDAPGQVAACHFPLGE